MQSFQLSWNKNPEYSTPQHVELLAQTNAFLIKKMKKVTAPLEKLFNININLSLVYVFKPSILNCS